MTKRKSKLNKSAKKFNFILFKIIKRGLKKVPVMTWATFALIGAFLVGLMLGIAYLESSHPVTSQYQKEAAKNEKYLKLISGYEDLSKLYSDQGANFAITFDRNMIENHPEEVNAAILSIDQYRDTILIERGRINELRMAADLPLEDLNHKQPRIN